jgi:hypothetical protein
MDLARLDRMCVERAMHDLLGLDETVKRYSRIAFQIKGLPEMVRAYAAAVDATRTLLQRQVRVRESEEDEDAVDWKDACEWHLRLFLRLLPFYYRYGGMLTNRNQLGGTYRIMARTDTALLFRTDVAPGQVGVRGTINQEFEVQLSLVTHEGKPVPPVRLLDTDPLHWVQPWDASVLTPDGSYGRHKDQYVNKAATRFWSLVNSLQSATHVDRFVPLGGSLYACFCASLLCPVARSLVAACSLFLARATSGPTALGQCEAVAPPAPGMRWDPTYLKLVYARPTETRAVSYERNAVVVVELCALDAQHMPVQHVQLHANASGRLCGFPTDRIQCIEGDTDTYVQCISAWIRHVTHPVRNNDAMDVLDVFGDDALA